MVVTYKSGEEGVLRLLTTGEAAELLHVHPNTLRKWSDNGLLKAYRLGDRRDRRFDLEEITRFLSENGQAVD